METHISFGQSCNHSVCLTCPKLLSYNIIHTSTTHQPLYLTDTFTCKSLIYCIIFSLRESCPHKHCPPPLFLGLKPAQMRDRIGEIEAFTELGDYLAMPVHTYSAGMRLRLAFAVSTCGDPEILLMDEWISAGDAAFVEKIRRRLDEFVNRAGVLVLASHNLDLPKRICTRGVLIEAGRVLASGPIDEVLAQYQPAA